MHLDRRGFLVATALLAGCGGGQGTPTGTDTGTRTRTPTDTATPTPTATASDTATPTPRPAIRGARSGELPGELVENEFEQLTFELLFAEYDTVDGEEIFKVGVWAENTGSTTIGTIKGIVRFYAGDELLDEQLDYLYDLHADERKRLDGRLREDVDRVTHWTISTVRN